MCVCVCVCVLYISGLLRRKYFPLGNEVLNLTTDLIIIKSNKTHRHLTLYNSIQKDSKLSFIHSLDEIIFFGRCPLYVLDARAIT